MSLLARPRCLHLLSAASMLLPIRFIPFVTVVQLFAVTAGYQTQTVALAGCPRRSHRG
jgi:hypothetical protein